MDSLLSTVQRVVGAGNGNKQLLLTSLGSKTVNCGVRRCLKDTIRQILLPKSLVMLTGHATSSFLIGYVLSSSIGGRYSDLSTSCDGTQSDLCLNDHKWFIIQFTSIVGFLYYMESVAYGYNCIQFPVAQQSVYFRMKAYTKPLAQETLVTVAKQLVLYYLIYAVLGSMTESFSSALLLLNERYSGGLSTWLSLLDPAMLYQALVCGVFVRLYWSFALLIFQTYQTQGYEFPLNDAKTDDSLLRMLEVKQDSLAKLTAYGDLAALCSQASADRRRIMYSLSQPGGHAKSWKAVYSATMGPLKELLGRVTIQYEIASNTLRPAVTAKAVKIETLKPGNAVSSPGVSALQNRNKSLLTAMSDEYPDAPCGIIFFDGQKQIFALEALTSLVCKSVTEDRYGVVQQDLGEILRTLLNLYEVIEKLFRTVPYLARRPNDSDLNRRSHLLAINFKSQLKARLYRIANTFRQNIGYVSGLNGNHVKRMHSFMSYKE